MSTGDQDKYSCFECRESIITVQREEGTIPYVFDCLYCSGLMKKEFAKSGALGRKATHELYRHPESLSDKLSVRKIEE